MWEPSGRCLDTQVCRCSGRGVPSPLVTRSKDSCDSLIQRVPTGMGTEAMGEKPWVRGLPAVLSSDTQLWGRLIVSPEPQNRGARKGSHVC